MITPSFSPTATERVLPKLALDFTTASLDSRITFTRALNTATVINSSGNIVPVNADLPRFDYNLGTGGACKGLLIEESRTNSLTNSVWSGAVSGSPGTAPTSWTGASTGNPSLTVTTSLYGNADGANALTLSGVATERLRFLQNFTAVSGTTYIISIYVESVTGTSGRLINVSGVTGTDNQSVISPSTPGRYYHSWTASANGTATVQFGLGTTSGIPGNCTITLSRIQLEAGAFPTSYIPTTTTALTRNADVATMTGTNFSSWYNQSQGSFFAEWDSFATINTTVAFITDDINSSGSTQLFLQSRNANTQIRIWQSTTGGGADNSATLSTSTGQGKATAAYVNNTSYVGSANGAAVVSTGVTPQSLTANALALGFSAGGLSQLDGHLKKFSYWPQALTNAELQAFSK